MLFAVIFKDKPEQGELRAGNLEAHVLWLTKNRDTVLVAGSLRERPQDTPLGGLWVVEAPTKEMVKELALTDPFFTCGLRESVKVFHWSKAFPARKVAV